MAPSISKRAFIEWDGEQPSEPTSTLVLTSTHRRFVDIRILISSDGVQDILPSWRLDWAFAGTSKSELRSGIHHSTWSHWIDSKTLEPENVTDEGDMLPSDDASGLVLEKGRMAHPKTGEVTAYVEGWRDVDALVVSNIDASATPAEWEKKRVCVVLEMEDEGSAARGMVVRVGQFVQGFLRVGEVWGLERWEWSELGGWKREVRMGDLGLPCEVCWELGDGVGEGAGVECGGFQWKCVEREEF